MGLTLLLLALSCILSASAKSIVWTGVGGNPLWNNAGNWDCKCLPTMADDVVINSPSIPTTVQIGGVEAPALCNSLTVGGTSPYTQILQITGPLNIGTGGGNLYKNGQFVIETSPSQPVNNAGPFTVDGNGFIFITGALTGPGSFKFGATSVLNFTSPAAKFIQTTVVVAGSVITQFSGGNGDIALTNGGSFHVSGTFTSKDSLIISSDASSSFIITGQFNYNGQSLMIQGAASITNWALSSGTTTLSDSVTVGTVTISSGAVLTLVGGPTAVRNFNSVLGSGKILNQGGVNNFANLATSDFEATGGNATIGSGTTGNFVNSGTFVSGTKLAANVATLTGGVFSGGIRVSVSVLNFGGVVNVYDDNTDIRITTSGNVNAPSQLTMTGGCSFTVSAGAKFTINKVFQAYQGAPRSKVPVITNDGAAITSAPFTVVGLTIVGTGAWNQTTSTWSFNNANFAATSYSGLAGSSVTLLQGKFEVQDVYGSSAITATTAEVTVGSLAAANFVSDNSNIVVGDATVSSTLQIGSGSFTVKSAHIGSLLWNGGYIYGATSVSPPTSAVFATQLVNVTGSQLHVLNNVVVQSPKLVVGCVTSQQCQFQTQNAFLTN